MSIETAMQALNTPTPEAAAPQQQAISPKEVAAATVEQETNAKNNVKLADSAADSTVPETAASKPAETPKEPLSAKFSALAKKEKAVVEQSKANKAKESAVAEREAAVAAREAKIKESESLWETDVLAAIKARTGMDYNQLTAAFLDGQVGMPKETDPVKIAKQTIEDFKKEMAQKEEAQKTSAQKAQEEAKKKEEDELKAAWESYNSEVNSFIETNKDDYELISTYAQQNLIADTVDEFYKANKRVLSVKEAADMVEAYLESEAEKALNTKKIGGKVTRTAKPTEGAKKDEEPRITKTLNNNMQPTSASVLPAASEADRMKRAMAALDSNKR